MRADCLLWRAWDGELALYNDITGHTHAFNALGLEVFEALRTRPADCADVSRRIAQGMDLSCDAELSAQVELMIRQFQSLLLIEPVDEQAVCRPAGE